MIYMLQIFDRIFISKSILTLVNYIWNSNFILCNKCIKYLYSFSNSNFNGFEIEKKVNERLFYVGFEERLIKEC